LSSRTTPVAQDNTVIFTGGIAFNGLLAPALMSGHNRQFTHCHATGVLSAWPDYNTHRLRSSIHPPSACWGRDRFALDLTRISWETLCDLGQTACFDGSPVPGKILVLSTRY